MYMCIRKYFYQALLLMVPVVLFGQLAHAVTFKFNGEIRPRTNLATNGVIGAKKGEHISFTTMRTRLGVKAIVDSNTSGYVEFQNLRTWGGEPPSTAPPSIGQSATSEYSNGLAVYQAYIDLKNVLGTGIELKGGRQEMSFDEVRLFGNFNWGQQGQSLDEIRADVNLDQFVHNLSMTTFYGKTIALYTHPTVVATNASSTAFEASFAGERLTYKLGDKGDRITPYFYYFLNPSRTGKLWRNNSYAGFVPVKNRQAIPNVAKHIEYAGGYFLKHFNVLGHSIRFRFDGAYEFGRANNTTDIKAYMLTTALGTGLDLMHGAKITLWYDYMSGDTNTGDGTDHTFIEPLNTFHKFFGLIDKFLNIPTAGIQDIAIKMSIKPTQKLMFAVHLHQFLSARTGTITSSTKNGTPIAAIMPRNIGQEIDVFSTYPIARNTILKVGYDHYFGQGTQSANIGDGRTHSAGIANTTLSSNYGYAMVDLKF